MYVLGIFYVGTWLGFVLVRRYGGKPLPILYIVATFFTMPITLGAVLGYALNDADEKQSKVSKGE